MKAERESIYIYMNIILIYLMLANVTLAKRSLLDNNFRLTLGGTRRKKAFPQSNNRGSQYKNLHCKKDKMIAN